MAKAKLNSEFIATVAGDITVFNYDGGTREYLSSSVEYLPVGVGIPANSCTDAPGESKEDFTLCRTADFTAWEYVVDHRGETVYSTATGEEITITTPGDYPENTTTLAPATQYDTWNGSEWVTDTEAQHAADVAVAEQQKQTLTDAAMQSVSVIQLKLNAGRKLTAAETARLDTVLDYIDTVTAVDTSTAPGISWPALPEV
ncbi:tail fiber assembly protein [Escherichia coli]|nr:tail fiber assembly protein [Escherichia coli]